REIKICEGYQQYNVVWIQNLGTQVSENVLYRLLDKVLSSKYLLTGSILLDLTSAKSMISTSYSAF
ncbi:MAG: hypothetical protein MJE68_10850, partial [Proteobacteria bacterium]|nr:hypothetical protein [Pseudomonadota bacterium]